jgi:hypothetical protein
MNSKMILKLAIWFILTVILIIAVKDGWIIPMGDAIELWLKITVEVVRDVYKFVDKKRR